MSALSRQLRTVIAAGAISVLAGTALVGCSTGGSGAVDADCTPAYEDFPTVAEGTLTVATYDFPPLMILDGDALSGVEGEILTEIAKRQCLTVTAATAGGANAAIPSVQTGRADVAAGGWLRTSARAEIVRLSAPVYLNPTGITSKEGLTAEELEGHRVGSIVGNLYNDSLLQWLGDDFVVYQDDEALYGDLASGRIDAVVAGSTTSRVRLEDNPIEGATVVDVTPIDEVPEFSAASQANFPSSKDNEAFGEAFDKLIEELREDGTIAEILAKYNLDESYAEVGEPAEL